MGRLLAAGSNGWSRAGSLQDICLRTITRSINSSNVFELMQVLDQVDMPQGADMQALCMRYVVQSFTVLRERRPPEDLKQALPAELYQQLEAAVLERDKLAAERKAILGHIVEPPDLDPQEVCHPDVPSVSGTSHSYSYEALVSGVRWPADVDPTNRECFLSHQEFQQLLGLSYDAFRALPHWKRFRLKKDLRLF